MIPIFKKVADLILYSNLFIALCAVAMTWQTQLLLDEPITFSPLIGLIFFSTLLIYALHRLFSLQKVPSFTDKGRYFIINKFKSHIWIYAVIAGIGAAICFFLVPFSIQLTLVLPGILSLGYVLPILGGKKQLRLRDFDNIKIFLVAGVWAYVTVFLPIIALEIWTTKSLLMLIERSIFIFAITLPFDIRDLQIDGEIAVKTIPSRIGIPNTLKLAFGLLFLFSLLTYINYSFPIFLGLFLSALLTLGILYNAPQQKHDYYFTGLLDGTMIIQFLLVWGILLFFG